jgi:hypothetical protein
MHTRFARYTLILALAAPGAGCTRAASVQAKSGAGVAPAAPGAAAASAPVSVEAARLLVRRAAMDVVVDDVARAAARAQSLLVGSGGYVERGQLGERSASFTLRIPENALDATLDSLATLGSVASRTVSAQDVTEEAIDLDARLQSLIATRDRLRKLHDSATSVTEVITVERELGRVQGEVDSLEGRLKHLRSSAALATVELSVRRKIVLGPLGVVAKGLGILLSKLFVWR